MSENTKYCPHNVDPRRCAICAGPMSRLPDTCLTDGSAVADDHKELKPNGQQKGYVVLAPEERAKGFVRPYRTTYVHVGMRPKHPTRPLSEVEQERFKDCDYVLFEEYPEGESPVSGRFWAQQDLHSGCNGSTTMGRAIAETYARDPKFYGSTFCVQCQKHLPLEEFVWLGTTETVGS